MISECVKQRCVVSLHTCQSVKQERECGRQVCSALWVPNTFHFISVVLLHLELCSKFWVFSVSNLFWFCAGLGGRALSGNFFLCDLWVFLVNIAGKIFLSFIFLLLFA